MASGPVWTRDELVAGLWKGGQWRGLVACRFSCTALGVGGFGAADPGAADHSARGRGVRRRGDVADGGVQAHGVVVAPDASHFARHICLREVPGR